MGATTIAQAVQWFTGELNAWANVDYPQIFDGYEQVYSHDEEVLDYCEVEDPSICYYRYEPVYIDQPIYRYESDLGEGQIYLISITAWAARRRRAA